MGAMNKHASCKSTWYVTTRASMHISNAVSLLMSANAKLECVLLAEFSEQKDTLSMIQMVKMVEDSKRCLETFRKDLIESIKIGQEVGNPYIGDFLAIDESALSKYWSQGMLSECEESIKRIGAEVKVDNLSTARRLHTDVDILISTAEEVIEVFRQAFNYADRIQLKPAIENGEFPLQRVFATHFSRLLVFMREYLVESLISTEVVFKAKGTALLAS